MTYQTIHKPYTNHTQTIHNSWNNPLIRTTRCRNLKDSTGFALDHCDAIVLSVNQSVASSSSSDQSQDVYGLCMVCKWSQNRKNTSQNSKIDHFLLENNILKRFRMLSQKGCFFDFHLNYAISTGHTPLKDEVIPRLRLLEKSTQKYQFSLIRHSKCGLRLWKLMETHRNTLLYTLHAAEVPTTPPELRDTRDSNLIIL